MGFRLPFDVWIPMMRFAPLSTFVLGLCGLLAASAVSQQALAQAAQVQSPTPPISAQPVPGEMELAKLIWSTMAAVDSANLAGNYSVLRDSAAPGFQINNDSARLATVFASIRASRLDLANTLLLVPTYSQAPQMLPENVLQLRGFFGLRPTAIQFDLQFQWFQGRWRLFGIALNPATLAQSVPPPVPPQASPPSPQPGANPSPRKPN